MSVETEADRLLERAKDLLIDTSKVLGDIVVDQPWGWDDYRASYQDQIKKAFDLVLEARDQLKPR